MRAGRAWRIVTRQPMGIMMKTSNWLMILMVFTLAFLPAPGVFAASAPSGQPVRALAAQQSAAGKNNDPMAKADQLYQRKKYDEAAAIMRPLAEAGDGRAAFALGLMEARGNLGQPDYVKARSWWEKAAQSGQPEAEYNLGLVYYRGVQDGGDGRDPARSDFASAIKWWEKAAGHGHGGAMYSLAGMARTGEGQPRDLKKAATWYRRASEAGHPEAQYQLAGLYLSGSGVEKNEAEAKKWMQKAADAGHPGAIQAMKLFRK